MFDVARRLKARSTPPSRRRHVSIV